MSLTILKHGSLAVTLMNKYRERRGKAERCLLGLFLVEITQEVTRNDQIEGNPSAGEEVHS